MHKLWNRKKITISECLLIGGEMENLSWTQKPPTRFVIETFHANYSCGLLRLRLESDWSQNNKHSRNNFSRSWFNGFHCNCIGQGLSHRAELFFILNILKLINPQ